MTFSNLNLILEVIGKFSVTWSNVIYFHQPILKTAKFQLIKLKWAYIRSSNTEFSNYFPNWIQIFKHQPKCLQDSFNITGSSYTITCFNMACAAWVPFTVLAEYASTLISFNFVALTKYTKMCFESFDLYLFWACYSRV